MQRLGIAAAALAGAVLSAMSPVLADDLRERANAVFKPLPSTVPAVKDNRITPEKIELGKALFFDPRLSRERRL